MNLRLLFVGSLVPLFALGACSGSDDSGGGSTPKGPAAEGPITSLPSGWNEIAPGGSTTCSQGSPYRFWVRPGTVDRVVIDFRGGGACWNKLTCAAGDSLFNPNAEPEPWVSDPNAAEGIYDHTRADYPFKDWHHVYVSYCTGDVHWGNTTQVYDPGGPLETTVEHRGAVNAQATLDWVYENIPTPDKVFVTGCSAGGYGAALWSAYVRQHYASSAVYLFADSAAGIITDNFFQESFPAWNATMSFPDFIGVDASKFTKLPELYIGLGATFPEMFISQYNTAFDATQHNYYAAMGGGNESDWSQKMQANLAEISSTTPSFHYYLAADYEHCVINKNLFYTSETAGTKLVDWLNGALDGATPANASCADSSCGAAKPAN
jgi:hypothetical protein